MTARTEIHVRVDGSEIAFHFLTGRSGKALRRKLAACHRANRELLEFAARARERLDAIPDDDG